MFPRSSRTQFSWPALSTVERSRPSPGARAQAIPPPRPPADCRSLCRIERVFSCGTSGLTGERDEAEGDHTEAVDHRGAVEPERRRRKTGGPRREAERQVNDDEGSGKELAALTWSRESGQRPERGKG